VFEYVGVRDRVAALFRGRLDVVDRDSLRPAVRADAMADVVYAF